MSLKVALSRNHNFHGNIVNVFYFACTVYSRVVKIADFMTITRISIELYVHAISTLILIYLLLQYFHNSLPPKPSQRKVVSSNLVFGN